jgi:hypothetical protein
MVAALPTLLSRNTFIRMFINCLVQRALIELHSQGYPVEPHPPTDADRWISPSGREAFVHNLYTGTPNLAILAFLAPFEINKLYTFNTG